MAGHRCQRPDLLFGRSALTAAGWTATGDAMLSWITQVVRSDLATRVSDGMAHGAIRSAQERQRQRPNADPVLIAMNDLIITYMEDPLPISSLCEELDVSMKQLRRRRELTFAKTPSAHYLGLRLQHGFSLIKNTHLSISEIAVATGFASVSAFSRAFRGQFFISPSQLRKTRDSNLSNGA